MVKVPSLIVYLSPPEAPLAEGDVVVVRTEEEEAAAAVLRVPASSLYHTVTAR